MKKDWKKPFVKWVVLKNVDIVTASNEQSRGDNVGVNNLSRGERIFD